MAKHRKRRTKYVGKHRAVVPRNDRRVSRIAVIAPLTLALVLYPSVAGNGEGFLPSVGDVIGIRIFDETVAAAEEVITEPTEPELPPVDELPSPTD